MKKSFRTKETSYHNPQKDSWKNCTDYYDRGMITYNGKVSYFSWIKGCGDNYIEIEFSRADIPNIKIKEFAYKESPTRGAANREVFVISNGFLYYDVPSYEAENSNLGFKLTKVQ